MHGVVRSYIVYSIYKLLSRTGYSSSTATSVYFWKSLADRAVRMCGEHGEDKPNDTCARFLRRFTARAGVWRIFFPDYRPTFFIAGVFYNYEE